MLFLRQRKDYAIRSTWDNYIGRISYLKQDVRYMDSVLLFMPFRVSGLFNNIHKQAIPIWPRKGLSIIECLNKYFTKVERIYSSLYVKSKDSSCFNTKIYNCNLYCLYLNEWFLMNLVIFPPSKTR